MEICPSEATRGMRMAADAARTPRASVAHAASTTAAAVSNQVASCGCRRSEIGLARTASSTGSSNGTYTASCISAVPLPAVTEQVAQQLLVAVRQLGNEPGQDRVAVWL